MGKIGNKELAAALADKYGLTRQASEKFVATLFSIVNEGLNEERQVKVKGLGTFKRIGVASRKSVDVNTGEPIIIKGRDKITFTPDAALRDEVNKPFMQFETVVVNEGVDFADIDNHYHLASEDITEDAPEVMTEAAPLDDGIRKETAEEEIGEVKAETTTTSEYNDAKLDAPKVQLVDEEDKVAPQDTEAKTEEQPLVAEESSEADEAEDKDEANIEADDSDTPETNKLKLMRCMVAAAIAVLVICLGGAFYMYTQLQKKNHRIEHLEAQISSHPTKTVAVRAEKPTTDAANKPDTTATPPKATTQHLANDSMQPSKAVSQATAEDFSRMGMNDIRVRTGAYTIVGVDRTVVAREGQTIATISKAWLGPGMECYVEAVNGGDKQLKAGDKVRIPKLKMKRLRK